MLLINPAKNHPSDLSQKHGSSNVGQNSGPNDARQDKSGNQDDQNDDDN